MGKNAEVASDVRLSARPQREEVTCMIAEMTTPACAKPPKNRKFTRSDCHARILSPSTRPYRNAMAPTRPARRHRRRVLSDTMGVPTGIMG